MAARTFFGVRLGEGLVLQCHRAQPSPLPGQHGAVARAPLNDLFFDDAVAVKLLDLGRRNRRGEEDA